jgi:hypothetical protein
VVLAQKIMKANLSTFFAAIATCLSPLLADAQGNLIVNGSFEANGGSLTSWTVQGQPLPYVFAAPATNAPDGQYIALIVNNGGSLSQTINTTPGMYYALKLSAIEFQGTNNVSIKVNGNTLVNLNFSFTDPITPNGSPENQTWESFNYIIPASSSLTTLTFTYYPQVDAVPNSAGGYDLYYGDGGLDAISVVAVPEPSTIGLLVVGLGALTGRWRRRRKS